MNKKIPVFFTALIIFCLSWTIPHQKKEIESAMDQYNRYLVSMNTDSIASIFAPDGDLGGIAHGRDSISRFLKRFKDFKVLSQKSSTELISLSGDSAIQKGMYWQTTIIPPHDTVHVKGNFMASWIWLDHAGWKIKRMDTQPTK